MGAGTTASKNTVMESIWLPMVPAYLKLDFVWYGYRRAITSGYGRQGFSLNVWNYGFKSAMDLFFDAGELDRKRGRAFIATSAALMGACKNLWDESLCNGCKTRKEQQSEFSDEGYHRSLMVALWFGNCALLRRTNR